MNINNNRELALSRYGDLGKASWLHKYGAYIVSGQPVWATRKTLEASGWKITAKEAIAVLCAEFDLAPMADEGAEQYCLVPREAVKVVKITGSK